MVNVELVYIPVGLAAIHLYLTVAPGATVADVLNQSCLLTSHPEIRDFSVGIFSTQVALDTPVRQGDRIEIYRPLLIDPKEKRRQRAKGK